MNTPQLLESAVTAHRKGQRPQAVEIYKQILASEPKHPDALHLLGLLRFEEGAKEEAVDLVRAAVDRKPSAPLFLSNLGNMLAALGRESEAIPYYRKALQGRAQPATMARLGRSLLRTGNAEEALALFNKASELEPQAGEYHNDRGMALAALRRIAEAQAAFEFSLRLDTQQAEVYNNLGNLHGMDGRVELAAAAYHKALACDPAFTEARNNLSRLWFDRGNRLHQNQEWAGAAEAFRAAIAVKEDFTEAWYNLAVTWMAASNLPKARAAYERVLQFEPQHHEAWNNLGHVVLAAGERQLALDCYRRCLEIKPDYMPGLYNLGVTLQQAEQFEEATAVYLRVLRADRRHADSWNNLSGIHLAEGRIEKARRHYEHTLRLAPEHPDASWNLALVHLQKGEFEEGWKGYELRTKQPAFPKRGFKAPFWPGPSAPSGTVLIWAEQGYGDAVQFARFLPLVAAAGARVVFECPDRLLPLFQLWPGPERVVAKGKTLPAFDFQLPLLSLPRAFDIRRDTIPPVTAPRIPSERAKRWDSEVRSHPGLRVGLCWAANPHSKTGALRSIPPELLAPLARIPGVTLFSLQRGDAAPAGRALPGLVEIEHEENDLLDTAAICAALDLVISVDTLIAHLAGTCARRAWTLLPLAADWRWLLDTESSPWYPNMTLFRQRTRGDWAEVVARLSQALRALAAGELPGPSAQNQTPGSDHE